MSKIFTKDFKKKLISYAKSYYKANVEREVDNPDFEICRDEELGVMRCNTCPHKEECSRGETIWEKNPNIIGDLTNALILCCERREQKSKTKSRRKND